MLAELRRRLHGGWLRNLAHVDWLTHHLDIAELGVPHRPCDPEVLHLRLGKGLIDAVDRPAWNASFIQRRDPMCARVLLRDGTNTLVQRFAVLGSDLRGRELR